MARPTAIATMAETSSTGRRPNRSASAAESGVASAMKTIAPHSKPRKWTREIPSALTP